MRKSFTKEVTYTTLKLAKIELIENEPKLIPLPDHTIIGSITMDKAQKLVNKLHNTNVTIFNMEKSTKKFQMEIEEFIKIAKEVE